ncbi:hypothetical protein [Thermoactinomyces mirandus]|uniref:Uncharacterized protein n=1 Tax=Thermoactinomyces mirandus TaxID=2756294 RepID=A0A7W1XSD4_9BACL|nr:hypothetical protein [Thermoactinomyces mirandus]MBA4602295.1 hypothetical protein [Thermoactinomyces mirandus]
MKRLLRILTPFIIIAAILIFLMDFRHVEQLSAEEKQAIEKYREQLVKGTLLSKPEEGIFYQKDFDEIAKSLNALHMHSHYYVFGPEWGDKLADPGGEFKKIEAIINKPVYVNEGTYYEFFQAFRQDLALSKETLGKRESHDILDDLSTLVFTDEIVEDRQWSQAATIQVMKDRGLKLIKEENDQSSGK